MAQNVVLVVAAGSSAGPASSRAAAGRAPSVTTRTVVARRGRIRRVCWVLFTVCSWWREVGPADTSTVRPAAPAPHRVHPLRCPLDTPQKGVPGGRALDHT